MIIIGSMVLKIIHNPYEPKNIITNKFTLTKLSKKKCRNLTRLNKEPKFLLVPYNNNSISMINGRL